MDLPPFSHSVPPARGSGRRFLGDTHGGLAERWALIAGGIAVACVASANLAATAAKRGMLPEIVWHTGTEQPVAQRLAPRAPGTIDYTVTASIASPAAVTHLDPCTGKTK